MTEIAGPAAPLAAALAGKGYDTLTAVQSAVLAPGAAARDLLVSAQTGSGKTVAFGLAIAPELLAGADRLPETGRPLALVIAPTRELALQVRREFEWLYAPAGAQLASCVGGMDYRTERRALERGAHVVVGTPGRLRDHLERGSLDLSALRVVVLDEADEMLDMGFQEDLEFLLDAAPAGRRTLMFSATVPKEIEKLAAGYQTDALRVVAQGEARQHADIAYRAVSVPLRDREGAIFNLLRLHEAARAIVFCKTRANVNHLFARMVNRGFQVVALSGELSQTERTHALQALRDGRARVCIATDVAARGIDLPGLELVIHADLPVNSEVLLHRSGRTGRAGAKGTSVLVVVPSDARKAQRLLAGARVEAEWGKPPSADDVQAAEDARLLSHPALVEPPGDEAAMAEDILAKWGPGRVAAAFVRLWRQGRSAPEVLSDAANDPPPAPRPPRDRGPFGPSVWFALSVGHEGRAEARWLLPKVCEAGGIGKESVGAIRVRQTETLVQIAEAEAGRFKAETDLGAGVTMRRLDRAPDLDAPARPASARPAPRRDKPAYVPESPREADETAAAASPRKAWMPGTEAEPDPRPAKKAHAAEGARKPHERKPDAPRAEGARKPYERKPYAQRAEGERRPYEKKPYGARADGERKPYGPRPEGERRAERGGSDRAAREKKPYAGRDAGAADRPGKAWAPREDAPRKAPDGGDRPKKPRWKGGAPQGEARPGSFAAQGARSHGGAGKAQGWKSHRAEDGGAPRPAWGGDGGERPKKPQASGGDRPSKPKSEGFKSHGGTMPPARPKALPADPRDTSRRFVPPKK
jgi:ATP-dependent RNA helicase DeaD